MSLEAVFKAGIVPDAAAQIAPFVPRVIWQTCKDRSALAPALANCVAQLQAMNPNWQHRLFDDESQDAALSAVCSDRFMAAYRRIEPRYGAARADLFRYVMIYLHGGIYMDLKSGTLRPLDQILHDDDRFIISQWDNGPDGLFPGVGTRKTLRDVPGGEYEQWFVCAAPGHPFLAEVLETVLRNIESYNPFVFGHAGKGVLNVMGPNVYTRSIRKLEDKHLHRRICAWTEGLRYTVLEGLKTHQALDKGHYSHVSLAPVTAKGLTGWPLLRYQLLETLYLPMVGLRGVNNARLEKRRAKQGCASDQALPQ